MNRKLVLGGLAGLFLLLTGLLSGSFSTLGTALFLIGYLGIWISGREGLGSARTYIGWGVCAVVIGLLALTVPNNEMISILGFREEVKEVIHTFRYGEDQLPMGQLWQAAKLKGDADRSVGAGEKPLSSGLCSSRLSIRCLGRASQFRLRRGVRRNAGMAG